MHADMIILQHCTMKHYDKHKYVNYLKTDQGLEVPVIDLSG